jgi:hypothetical protein
MCACPLMEKTGRRDHDEWRSVGSEERQKTKTIFFCLFECQSHSFAWSVTHRTSCEQEALTVRVLMVIVKDLPSFISHCHCCNSCSRYHCHHRQEHETTRLHKRTSAEVATIATGRNKTKKKVTPYLIVFLSLRQQFLDGDKKMKK